MLFSGSKNVVGLDIGSSSLKLVELSESRRGVRLENLALVPLPPEAIVDGMVQDAQVVTDAIKELVASQKLKGRLVATSVSGHSVIIKKITLPAMSQKELEESIQWEAEQYIPFDIHDVSLDFQILGPSHTPDQMDVVLVAAKKEMVDEYVAVLSRGGLKPAVMDVAVFAIENMYEANYSVDEQEVVALINVGASFTNINVLKGRESVFTRDLAAGGNRVTAELQKELSLPFQEAEAVKCGKGAGVDPAQAEPVIRMAASVLATEAQRCLDFFSITSSDERVQRIYLSGGCVRLPSFQAAIEEKTGCPVETLNPFSRISVDEKQFDLDYVGEMAPLAAVGVGLALRRFGER
ncbi:MAG: type IV pilus assembly protein PilM [Deltaproteobacteria bacterium]|nr:type IV pilus assembly protein PilM [Deltaproteobacteria bacterium]